jgi:SAM-dependent methyltransferase
MTSLTPTSASKTEVLREQLREFYGRRIQRTADLKTNACCADDTRRRFAGIVSLIPDEVVERTYGCGCSIPEEDLTGATVLDLGSGSGLDAFILSRLVGPSGRVVGLDMTAEQLEFARSNVERVSAAFGYSRPNVAFVEGYIETADAIEDSSIDLVVSDCVVNLSPRKDRVIETIRRVLKPGGELYIADIVADRRVPAAIRSRPDLVAECLGGACYEHDLFDLLADAGFRDARVVRRSLAEADVAGVPIRFDSLTFRAFKLDQPLDRRCEDYGQTATYRGDSPGSAARFVLDEHHVFPRGRPVAVCRNTARMLSETRLGRYFDVTPPLEHFGLFPCGAPAAPAAPRPPLGGGCC